MEEIKIFHRDPCTGTVTVECSLDGRNVEVGLSSTFAYDNVRIAEHGFGLSARWYNITVQGTYDLTNLETRSSRKGKR